MGKAGQRRQERDRRAGRTWSTAASNRPAALGSALGPARGLAPAAGYVILTAHLDRLRGALAADRFAPRAPMEVRRDRADLERSLGDAITRAFAADAHGAPLPDGVTSWVGEGLARCDERELLLFATQ